MAAQLDFLSGSRQAFTKLPLDDADIFYCAEFFNSKDTDRYFARLQKEIEWQQGLVKVFGRQHKTPRLSALYGDTKLSYSYSGHSEIAKPWTKTLKELNEILSDRLEHNFNSVLANLYRDGNDTNGWHADNEPELGSNPVIASLSFGEARDFQLKHRATKKRVDINLEHGSLLLMAGATQKNWLHCLPRRKRCAKPRINLTYRKIVK